MTEILLITDVISALALIVLVLLQQSKSSDIGAVFGGGGSQSMFGSKGSASFLSRTTAILAIVFFLSSIGLMVLTSRQQAPQSVTQKIIEKEQRSVPKPIKKDKPKTSKKTSTRDIPIPE